MSELTGPAALLPGRALLYNKAAQIALIHTLGARCSSQGSVAKGGTN